MVYYISIRVIGRTELDVGFVCVTRRSEDTNLILTFFFQLFFKLLQRKRNKKVYLKRIVLLNVVYYHKIYGPIVIIDKCGDIETKQNLANK